MNSQIKDTLKLIDRDHQYIVLLKKEPTIVQSKEIKSLDYLLNGLISDQSKNFEIKLPAVFHGKNFDKEIRVIFFQGNKNDAQAYLNKNFLDIETNQILFLEDSETIVQ